MKNKLRSGKKKSLEVLASEVNLPGSYPWKVVGFLADDLGQFLGSEEEQKVRGLVRNRDQQALFSLCEAWSLKELQSIKTPESGTPLMNLRAKYQIGSLLKKFIFPGEATTRREAAMKSFLAAEEACGRYNREGYVGLAWGDGAFYTNVFTSSRAFLRKLLGVSVPGNQLMTKKSRHGPGSNLDTKEGLVSYFHKFENWPYSCTVDCFQEARLLIQSDERWLGALEDSYRERYNIPKTMILDQVSFWFNVLKIVPGNRITFVPKNAKTERSIAIEPAMNLMLQLGVDGYIRKRLKRWGVDIDTQEKNQRLARIGSINPGSFVTLDLSAASDSIALKLCELLLPADWYSYLMKLRSPVGDLGGGQLVMYEKISSMGNGFTFALETAIFASIVYGVMIEVDGLYDPEACAIFGDDIIVPSRMAGEVIEALSRFGFALNLDKSFLFGYVRESCGADWFKGEAVRPVFLENVPLNVMELLNDINRLKRALWLRFGIEESKVEKEMVKWIPEIFRDFIGPFSDETFDAYLHCASAPPGADKHGVRKYKCLTAAAREIKNAKDFLFRKLMHDLKPAPPPPLFSSSDKWGGTRLTASGSRFTITRRNSVKVSRTYSVTTNWSYEYTEKTP